MPILQRAFGEFWNHNARYAVGWQEAFATPLPEIPQEG